MNELEAPRSAADVEEKAIALPPVGNCRSCCGIMSNSAPLIPPTTIVWFEIGSRLRALNVRRGVTFQSRKQFYVSF